MNHKMKKLSELLLASLVVIAALSMTWTGLRTTKYKTEPASAEPYETMGADIPEDAIVIVIDAGHGGFDGGAIGSRTGVNEAVLNLAVAKKLADKLLARGYYIIMTRETDEALAETKSKDMNVRKRIMQLDVVNFVISIHMNKFKDPSVSGPMVFYMKNSAEGKAFAECVMNSICIASGRQKRAPNPEDLFVLRVPNAPSVLVECGFLSNSEDEKLLCDEAYQELLADAIADGADEYIKNALISQGG